MKIWLLRHAQSRTQTGEETGWDPALSDLGLKQAEHLSSYWNGQEFDKILISPLQRARMTYLLSEANGKHVQLDSRLVECTWGLNYKDILPYEAPDIAEPDLHDAWLVPSVERSASLIADLEAMSAENVLLVGHWAIFSIFLYTYLGVPPKNPDSTNDSPAGVMGSHALMENACISILEMTEEPKQRNVLQWNIREHMGDLIS